MGTVGSDVPEAVVRPLEPGDIPYAVGLAQSEGWAFTSEDFHRLLPLGGGQVVLLDGAPAGFLTSTVYGQVAWVGNVIVEPSHRNRGVGTALVEATLEHLQDHGVETVRLYAVRRARSLYARAGFVEEGEATSLHGRGVDANPLGEGVEPFTVEELDEVAPWDAERFGASRRDLLHALLTDHPGASFLLRGDAGALRGFVVAKPAGGSGGEEGISEVGPLVTRERDRQAAARLLDAGLAAVGDRPCEVGVRGEVPHARSLLEARGFQEVFPAVTMRWGRDAHGGVPETQVAVGGMEKG